MKAVNLAVVGTTGMVGQTILEVLEEKLNKTIFIENLYLFASARSKGQKITFSGKEYEIEELTEESFNRPIDIALFSVEGEYSAVYAPIAAKNGCIVIDNSSQWRMDDGVPLIVPEVNPEDILCNKGIIANPNCSTIQAVVALNPLHKKYKIKRVVYSTYQAVSGAGVDGYRDLENGIKGLPPTKFPYPIANNLIPHIDVFTDNGYTKEELKMIQETHKIMHAPEIKITATTVRVPVYIGHSESINVEFENTFDLNELIDTLKNAPGLVVQDNTAENLYPMPINAAGSDHVYVGRIRRDFSVENGVNLWVVADNVRKGAASNAVQIAELIMKDRN